jgi:hypothetical protein
VFTWEIETRSRIPGNINHHLNPAFPGPIRAITTTDILEWISGRIAGVPATPRSSMKPYCDLFRTNMNSAEIDGIPALWLAPGRDAESAKPSQSKTLPSASTWIEESYTSDSFLQGERSCSSTELAD